MGLFFLASDFNCSRARQSPFKFQNKQFFGKGQKCTKARLQLQRQKRLVKRSSKGFSKGAKGIKRVRSQRSGSFSILLPVSRLKMGISARSEWAPRAILKSRKNRHEFQEHNLHLHKLRQDVDKDFDEINQLIWKIVDNDSYYQRKEVPNDDVCLKQQTWPSPTRKPKRIHVANIPFRFKKVDLFNLFRKFGPIEDIEIIYNKRGSKGFGFLTFSSYIAANNAKKNYDGALIEGREISVKDANLRVETEVVDGLHMYRYQDMAFKNNSKGEITNHHPMTSGSRFLNQGYMTPSFMQYHQSRYYKTSISQVCPLA